MKPIRLTFHALVQASERGASEEEIAAAIQEGKWDSTDQGRLECSFIFQFEAEWRGRFYASKRVRPIFVEETDEIVVITVYTYYF